MNSTSTTSIASATSPSTRPNSTKLAFNLSTGADTGGAAIREIEAFRSKAGRALRLGWEVRAMVAATNYIGYPEDVPHSLANVERYWEAAKVVHLNHTLHGHVWYDKGRNRPIVLEHHGLHRGSFDIDFNGVIRQCVELGITQIGSTVNLELFGPITWAPIPYDLDELAKASTSTSISTSTKPEVITIGHAPTNRAVKSTAAFLAAMDLLIEVGLPVRALLIENKTHQECLRLKAKADIFVDQLTLGYGCNAIEAWGMGIPVVGGVADPAWRKHMAKRWSANAPEGGSPRTEAAIEDALPFFDATEANLVKRLTALVINKSLREEYAERGLAHVRRWHTQAGHVKQMVEIYEATTPPLAIAKPPLRLSHKERLALLRANRAATLRRVKLGL